MTIDRRKTIAILIAFVFPTHLYEVQLIFFLEHTDGEGEDLGRLHPGPNARSRKFQAALSHERRHTTYSH